MKYLSTLLISLVLAACGGGVETPVATSKTIVPHPVANAATVSGGSGIAVHIYQALYGRAPSNAMLLDYTTQATADPSAFARNLANNFASTSSTALAKLVLDNLGVTATTVTAVNGQGQSEYAILLDALGQMFTFYGLDARGQIILNATNLFGGLESDPTYGDAAVSYNNQATANLAYSSNSANTSAALVSTAPTYCLTGTVSGAVSSGVTITLAGGNNRSAMTSAAGAYSFCVLDPGLYTVTPTFSGYSFTALAPITITTANVASNNFTSAKVTVVPRIVFIPVAPMTPAVVGVAYNRTVVQSVSGGQAPYHYQLDTLMNGAPPMGMIIDLNGNLTGTPSLAGTYTFGVCAVDLTSSASSPCPKVSIAVQPALTASLAGTGSGSVASTPAGIACGATCKAGFAAGSSVTLTATPSANSTFVGWSGACSGTGPCVVTMTGSNAAVTATFTSTTAATNDGMWNLQVVIRTCYEFTNTTPITITGGKFSGPLFRYCWNAKTGATWLSGGGACGTSDQYWIGAQDVSVNLAVTGSNIDGSLTLAGSGCNGSNGFSSGRFDTATHGSAVSSWGTLTFSK